ncbi:MAG: hypothetical protein M3154_01590, partial [Candidatus Eremiobacteraeota bacterium]|nr:hypothetical protein [Candidatus Eremiobacteraeota bacterium]
REDGLATEVPPAVASAPGSDAATASPAASTQPGSAVFVNGQAPATPYPGTAPQSVINAQNAMRSPSPSPTPRR